MYLEENVQGVSKKYPPKTFGNIFTSVKSFCVKFRRSAGSSYPHESTKFCGFTLIFQQMALTFSRVPIVFTLSACQVLCRPIHPENENVAFRK